MSVVMTRDPDPDVQQAIEITNFCQTFHCLPAPGALFEQDSMVMYKIRVVLEAQHERAKLDQQKGR